MDGQQLQDVSSYDHEDRTDVLELEQHELEEHVEFLRNEVEQLGAKLSQTQAQAGRLSNNATTHDSALRVLIRKFARHEEDERKERMLLIQYIKEDFEERKLFRETIVELKDLIKTFAEALKR